MKGVNQVDWKKGSVVNWAKLNGFFFVVYFDYILVGVILFCRLS